MSVRSGPHSRLSTSRPCQRTISRWTCEHISVDETAGGGAAPVVSAEHPGRAASATAAPSAIATVAAWTTDHAVRTMFVRRQASFAGRATVATRAQLTAGGTAA